MKQAIFYIPFLLSILMLSISSCSKKPIETEEAQIAEPNIYSGVFYNYCDPGPIYFNIDSLVSNCPFQGSLDELIDLDSLRVKGLTQSEDEQPLGCQPKPIVIDESNWNFSITIAWDNGYDVDWLILPLSQQSIEVKTTFENGKYPFPRFLNGYEIQISENKALTLLFFNTYIGGCIHDYMVWEYVESE